MAIQTFAPTVGGAELQLERLLPRLAARGVVTEVLTRAVSNEPRRDFVAGARVRRTPIAGESARASLAYVADSLAHIARHRAAVDVVHAHGALSPATIALGARALGLQSLVTPLGAGVQGDLARLARKPGGRLRSRLLARNAWFVALSAEARAEILARHVDPGRVLLIPNGVDGDVFRPASDPDRAALRADLGLPSDRFVVAYVGRLHPVKGLDTLLRAAASVPEIELLVAGDGPERERLIRLGAELDVHSRTRFVGYSTRVPDILRASDAFLLPSRGEGMSNALLEAMACGLPCVATATVGGVPELLGDGRGLVVAEDDVAGWAAAIERLVRERVLRSRLGDAAARHVARAFGLDAAADRLTAAYTALADGHCPAR